MSPRKAGRACWIALLCLMVPMFASYFFDDMFSTLSQIFQHPESLQLGWDSADYGFYAGGYSFLCVCGGLIVCGILLDVFGVRIVGSVFVGLMAAGAGIVLFALRSGLDPQKSLIIAYAGCMIFGLGSEIAGVAVTRSIAKWFKGRNVAFAMGAQVAVARLGTATAFILSPALVAQKAPGEIYTLAETFDSMLDTIEAGLKRERQFSSDVSHELRTPLSVLQMQCDAMLERDDLDTQTRAQIEVLQRKIKNLSSMISQLLLLSRADRGQEKLQKEDLDLSELAEMLTEEYEEIAAERHITLHADIQPDIYMHADQTLMIRLFANLLQNALTYNRENGTITMTLKQADDIILTVQDTGIGISEEHLPHIWERFYQADPSRSDTESSGLGLSMVKWIVEAHQGTITVSSKLNEGTTFTCVFPKQRTLQ